jgi:MFS superfamily sulfate permease-like transporter
LFILLVVLFLSDQLSALPQPVLAAVVLMAVAGLFQISALKHLWQASRPDFVVAMASLLGVLGSGLLRGVMIGAIISLVQLMHRASRPHVATLGRIPGTRRYSDMQRHTDNEPTPEVLIVRPEGSLIYFNIDHVCDTILARLRHASEKPRLVVLDLSAAPYVDLQSADTLARMADELRTLDVQLQVVEAHSGVRDRLTSDGLEARTAGANRFMTIADALDEFARTPPRPAKLQDGS